MVIIRARNIALHLHVSCRRRRVQNPIRCPYSFRNAHNRITIVCMLHILPNLCGIEHLKILNVLLLRIVFINPRNAQAVYTVYRMCFLFSASDWPVKYTRLAYRCPDRTSCPCNSTIRTDMIREQTRPDRSLQKTRPNE